jgi:hypothetical protein
MRSNESSQTGTFRVCAAMIAIFLTLGLSTAGCGKATKVMAIAADLLGPDPFVPQHLGKDESGIQPGPNGGVRSGEIAGLYGGTLKKKACDKTKLIKYLTDPANAQKASAWAGVRKIKVKSIPRYVKRLTPVLLRNDTRIRNHGFREGAAKVFEVLLEAGIAVLVDEHGEPVVKCNCGNPLSESPPNDALDFKVDIPDKEWKRRYEKKKVTVVTPKRTKRIRRFYLADIVTGRGIGRPAGTDASRDVKLPAPPDPPPPLTHVPPAIVGTWRASSADISVIEISQTEDDTFVGAIADEQRVTDTCTLAAGRRIWTIKGDGPRYTGTTAFVDVASCKEVRQISAEWDMPGQDTLRLCFDAGKGENCENLRRETK